MVNKSKKILSEISAGELLDKISILEIKLEKVSDKIGLIEIKKEHSILKKVQDFSLKMTEELNKLTREIKDTNLKLWNIEDKIRECEKNKDFGQNFIELARKFDLIVTGSRDFHGFYNHQQVNVFGTTKMEPVFHEQFQAVWNN